MDQEKNALKNQPVKSEKPDVSAYEIKNELPPKESILGKRTPPTDNKDNNQTPKKQKLDEAASDSDSDDSDIDIFNKNKNKG